MGVSRRWTGLKIITTRRICQVFFLALFLWFCVVTTLGDAPWQVRGWPVNLFLQLDPLVGLGTLLATRTLYRGLLWGVATVILTLILGRFFCGWVCPFGTIHQAVGFLAHRKKKFSERIRLNRYHSAQGIKYILLTLFLSAAAADLLADFLRFPRHHLWLAAAMAAAVSIWALICRRYRPGSSLGRTGIYLGAVFLAWGLTAVLLADPSLRSATLQTGLLDPLPLMYRSINLALLPLADDRLLRLSVIPRLYAGAGLIAAVFISALLLNLVRPRFYCRFVCPLGGLFGLFGRFALWRIGKSEKDCKSCVICEKGCEGACTPSTRIRISECTLCMNCRESCRHGRIGYRTRPSVAGEILQPDLSRRAFVVSFVSGVMAGPVLRVGGNTAGNWAAGLVRPPGALGEADFLTRCVKCGQCMRICPTNVIQPAGFEHGFEALWTPALNFRIGTSGCQLNCIACGSVCPTSAIRSIRLDEKLGKGEFARTGPIRIGTAFVDRGRCLPWAMDRPCIVCQENCPVSPKAIFTREVYRIIQPYSGMAVNAADSTSLRVAGQPFAPDRLATGDYFCTAAGRPETELRRITGNSADSLKIDPTRPWISPPAAGSRVEIRIRLQQPHVDPARCIGCGVCEHECPVRGNRAIRVTADNETRTPGHGLLAPG